MNPPLGIIIWYYYLKRFNPHHSSLKIMDLNQKLDHYKLQLSHAEDEYSFAIANGDWAECSHAKGMVAKYRKLIGQLIKQRMKLSLV